MNNTTTLVTSPAIQGNIGTCTVQSNKVKTDNSFFTAQYQSVQINSCTGEIIGQYTYTSYFGLGLSVLVGIVFLIIILRAWASSY